VRNDNCNLPQQKSRDIITTEVQEINNLYMPSSKKIGKIIIDKFEAVKFGDTGTKDVDAYSSEQIQIQLQLYRSKRAKRKFVLEEENNMVHQSEGAIESHKLSNKVVSNAKKRFPWTSEENAALLQAIIKHDRDWVRLGEAVPTKAANQIKSRVFFSHQASCSSLP